MSTSSRPTGKCCVECLFPTQELWAHKCPSCGIPIHILCCLEWGIPPSNGDDEYLCRSCHFTPSSNPSNASMILHPNLPSNNPPGNPPSDLSTTTRGQKRTNRGRRQKQANPPPAAAVPVIERRLSQIERLELIVQQQKRTSVMSSTVLQHMSRVKVLTRVLWKIKELREEAFELDPVTRKPLRYIGDASDIYRLKLPISVRVATLLFAQVSIDGDLVLRKRRNIDESDNDDPINDNQLIVDLGAVRTSGRNIRTVSAQTYQNYKSALKWWHEYEDTELLDKTSSIWPTDVDTELKTKIKSYKREVGIKKCIGVMNAKEGKSPYNVTGYIAICSFFNMLTPQRQLHPLMEIIFAAIFTKLSVNTIGRSDNIGDIRLSDIDWDNDALVLSFANTKSDIEGETTSDKKRIFANPFMPEICCVLGLAIYVWVKCRVESATWLFDGEEQHIRYYKQLKLTMSSIPETVQ